MVKKLIQRLNRKLLGWREKTAEEVPAVPAREQVLRRAPDQRSSPSWQYAGSRMVPSNGPGKLLRSVTASREGSGSVPSNVPRKQWAPADFQVPALNDVVRFHDFDLPTPIMRAIHDLGFKYCTPIQGKVLALAKGGRNIAGRAQTGTGKTAAFLICMFSRFLASDGRHGNHKPGTPRALVLAPTRELVLQIAKDARDLGKYTPFRCMAVYGGMDFENQRRELAERPVDLVAATPGRLLDFKGRGVLDLKQVEVLVIDEADRMLDMGFIPDVRRIVRATPPSDRRQTMLFSATLTKDVLRLASQWMPDPVICEVEPEQVAVDTVKQVVYVVGTRDKFTLLYNLLVRKAMDRVLIFGNRRDTTQRLAENLERHGIRCEYLSGAVRQEKRLKVLDGFRKGRIRVVVATDVAGRGLHVDNISHVINYDFPYEPQDYVHRIGRTGRAGLEGTSISFACEEESFVIPEIEKYIGEPLKCIMPGPELLAAVPRAAAPCAEPPRPGVRRAWRPRSQGARYRAGR